MVSRAPAIHFRKFNPGNPRRSVAVMVSCSPAIHFRKFNPGNPLISQILNVF